MVGAGHRASSREERAVVGLGCLGSPSGFRSSARRARASQRFCGPPPWTCRAPRRSPRGQALGDALHDLPLLRRQDAEYVGDPLVVFPCGQLAVLSALLMRDMAAVDEALGYAAVPARLVLDEVIDHGPARVRKRISGNWPDREHLGQGLGGRVLGFLQALPPRSSLFSPVPGTKCGRTPRTPQARGAGYYPPTRHPRVLRLAVALSPG